MVICHSYEVFNLEYNYAKTNVDDSITNEVDVKLTGVSDTLEDDKTQLEVLGAIRALKKNKGPGPDGFSCEFYKYAATCVVGFITK